MHLPKNALRLGHRPQPLPAHSPVHVGQMHQKDAVPSTPPLALLTVSVSRPKVNRQKQAKKEGSSPTMGGRQTSDSCLVGT